ncbi:hypothetical protein ACGFYZ_40425 [Streptomyces sp. NPDC048330]|uniref:hypothetical protein n=1 Tax=Streptomyces sp. NPDC048330 TaxID=3365533 RepID=UPI003723A25D
MHDIQENGLLQPIVLDRSGRILDGRGRLAVCERLYIEPTFITYDGAGADTYSLSVNLKRRSFTKGQSAMITVKARATMGYEACPEKGQEACPDGGHEARPEKGTHGQGHRGAARSRARRHRKGECRMAART